MVRDLLRGSVTYGQLQNSLEGIPTNILADRLRKLGEAGLIAKSAYQEHPVRYAYELTQKGKALSDVLLALVRWGKKHTDSGESSAAFRARPKTHSAPGSRIIAAVASYRASASKWFEARLLSAIGLAATKAFFAIYSTAQCD